MDREVICQLQFPGQLNNIFTDLPTRHRDICSPGSSSDQTAPLTFSRHGCQLGSLACSREASTAAPVSAVRRLLEEISSCEFISAHHIKERAAGWWLYLLKKRQDFLEEVGGGGGDVWASRNSEHKTIFIFEELSHPAGASLPLVLGKKGFSEQIQWLVGINAVAESKVWKVTVGSCGVTLRECERGGERETVDVMTKAALIDHYWWIFFLNSLIGGQAEELIR